MTTIDVGSALDDAQWSTYQKLLVFATAMTIILDGLDNQLLGAALPALMRERRDDRRSVRTARRAARQRRRVRCADDLRVVRRRRDDAHRAPVFRGARP